MKKYPANLAFTLLELMAVLAVIVILTGMVVGVAGMVQNKAAKSRASAEIAMLGAAAEAYKAENGSYPRTAESTDDEPKGTDALEPRKHFQPTKSAYSEASLDFYRELTGDKKKPCDGVPDEGEPVYLKEYDPRILKSKTSASKKKEIEWFQDPFGFPYGYSTAAAMKEHKFQKELRSSKGTDAKRPTGDELLGYNSASYDLWSTGGSNPSSELKSAKDKENEQAKWIKNW